MNSTVNTIANTNTKADIDALFPIHTHTLNRLRTRLAEAADNEGIVAVAYRPVDTPVGPMLLAATDQGVARVAFEHEDFDRVLQALAERISPRILRDPKRLNNAAGQLDEYFAGTRRTFDLRLDFRLSSGFRQTVQHFL